MLIELNPEVVVGFGISNENSIYETIQRANIPVVYNGDWTEETPLGKAEWIKFFAPFFQKEGLADSIFSNIQRSYDEAKDLAKTANTRPTVISGAMYKDGKSWAAQFLQDANADYLWKNTSETGSLSLSWEKVLEKGQQADFWIGPAQFIDYQNMQETSEHYAQFDAFKNKQVFTFANTKGATGGLLYYELAPQRPDLVLKDLIHILHPELLPKHQPILF
ncbi:putative lipoprotein [Nymphon striatum]|nr:putative lipoprotein [Nymphon striatum]